MTTNYYQKKSNKYRKKYRNIQNKQRLQKAGSSSNISDIISLEVLSGLSQLPPDDILRITSPLIDDILRGEIQVETLYHFYLTIQDSKKRLGIFNYLIINLCDKDTINPSSYILKIKIHDIIINTYYDAKVGGDLSILLIKDELGITYSVRVSSIRNGVATFGAKLKVTPYGGVDQRNLITQQQIIDELILEALSGNKNLANMSVLARITLFIAGCIGIDKIIFGDKSAGDIRNKTPGDERYYDVLLLPVRLFTGKESIYSKLVMERGKTLIHEDIKKTTNANLIKEYSGKTIEEYYEGKDCNILPDIPENLITDPTIGGLSRSLFEKITYQHKLDANVEGVFKEFPIDESKLEEIFQKQAIISDEIKSESIELTKAITKVNDDETNSAKLTKLIINSLVVSEPICNSTPEILNKWKSTTISDFFKYMETTEVLNSSECEALEFFSNELSNNLINSVFFYKTTPTFMKLLSKYMIVLDGSS